MPDTSFVKGDSDVEERKRRFREDNRFETPVLIGIALLTISLLAIYGIWGGRGWLAGGLVAGFYYVLTVMSSHHNQAMFSLKSVEDRLRIVESDSDATIQNLDMKDRRERERGQRDSL